MSRPLLALQMAAFATAAWLLLSLLDPGEHAGLLWPVALAILGLMAAWAGVFAAILWIYVAVSLDRFSDLRREARRASVSRPLVRSRKSSSAASGCTGRAREAAPTLRNSDGGAARAGKRPQSLVIPPNYRPQIALSPFKSLSIPFTGEYHLFRASSVELPSGSVTQSGSPLDAVYVTTNGGEMETDAYQEFDPPLSVEGSNSPSPAAKAFRPRQP